MKNALILVDLQNDFLPGGPLGVPEGDAVVPLLSRLCDRFDHVVATRDWHPAGHGSFAANHPGREPFETIDLNGLPQVLWPVHCVQDTPGAAFAEGLPVGRFDAIISKGTDPAVDSYSGFFDNGRRQATGLDRWLRKHAVTTVFVGGLATDYCVQATVLDALELGYHTYVLTDAVRGVNLQAGDADRALELMDARGAQLIASNRLPEDGR